MKALMTVNGLPVEASYSERDIEELFRPLLRKWARMYREKGSRILVLLGAPPAMGKSTLVEFLSQLMKTPDPETEGIRLTAVGMDGFHYPNEYLESHYGFRDGKEILLKTIKGSPETFDTAALAEKLWEIKKNGEVYFPFYDRTIHNPVKDAIRVDGEIVLVEGNYLLLDDPRWEKVREPADETVFIKAEAEALRERLVSRKALGIGRAAAEEFVDRSDMRNVRQVLRHFVTPDVLLQLETDGSFSVIHERN